jgi:hypothetical protein
VVCTFLVSWLCVGLSFLRGSGGVVPRFKSQVLLRKKWLTMIWKGLIKCGLANLSLKLVCIWILLNLFSISITKYIMGSSNTDWISLGFGAMDKQWGVWQFWWVRLLIPPESHPLGTINPALQDLWPWNEAFHSHSIFSPYYANKNTKLHFG